MEHGKWSNSFPKTSRKRKAIARITVVEAKLVRLCKCTCCFEKIPEGTLENSTISFHPSVYDCKKLDKHKWEDAFQYLYAEEEDERLQALLSLC